MPVIKREKKNTSVQSAPIEHRMGSINARIIDVENGLRVLSGVGAVRIRSKEYSLLVMDDYMPALGKIEGDIIFLTKEEEVVLSGIKGFYKHQHNEFTLLIEGRVSQKGETESEAGAP